MLELVGWQEPPGGEGSSGGGGEGSEPRCMLDATRFAVISDYWDRRRRRRSSGADGASVECVVCGDGGGQPPAARAAGRRWTCRWGRCYHDFIYPYTGRYGAGSETGSNRFFPVMGNHDWGNRGGEPYLSYFTLPGREHCCRVRMGDVELFMLDSERQEPDGRTGNFCPGAMAAEGDGAVKRNLEGGGAAPAAVFVGAGRWA